MGSAVVVAALVVVGLIFYFGASGTFKASELLISPDKLADLKYKIEFVQVDANGKGWGRHAVSLESYKMFYDEIASLRSIPELNDEVVNQFRLITPSTLTITAPQDSLFLQVQFQGSLFRISHGEEQWVYFEKNGIYQQLVNNEK